MKHFMDISRIKENEGSELTMSNIGAFQPGNIIQISEKVDGANASIALDNNGNLVAYSRKNELNYQNTLRGFWNYVQTLDKEKFQDLGKYVCFGEWLVSHTVKYNADAYNKWYVYDIYDTETEEWLPQSVVKEFAKTHGLEYIHVLYEGEFISWDHCRTFLNSPAYGDSQEGCFSSRAKILMGDGSQKPMCEIQIGDMVKSYNILTKTVENKRVINKFYNGLKPVKEWDQINVFPRGCSASKLLSGKITVTNNHLFFNGKDYSPINDLDHVYHYGIIFDNFRLQAFLGMMCSDGNLSKEIFKISQRSDRIDDFYKLFEGFVSPRTRNFKSGKGSNMSDLLFVKQITKPIYDEYGLTHNKFDYIKAFKNFDDVGWAYFFIGDGCCSVNHSCSLDLSSYSDEEVNIIKNEFDNHFKVKTSVYIDKRVSNGSGKSLWLNKKDRIVFLQQISKYILPSHRYKLNILNKPDEFIGYPPKEYGLVKRKIYKKVPFESTKYSKGHINVGAWDLEIEDNHNYFVSGCLVHNCVVKNQSKLNSPDIRQPFYLKIVNDSFMETKAHNHIKKVLDPQHQEEKNQAEEIANEVVTKARVQKEIHKMIDEGILPEKLQPKDMSVVARNLPKRIYDDIVKEELERISDTVGNQYFGKAVNTVTMNYAKEIVLR